MSGLPRTGADAGGGAGRGRRLAGTVVLLVDDHADLSDNISEILGAEGAQVIAAPHAAAALELHGNRDLVALVDINLPDSTGLALLPKLKAIEGSMIEVVLMTGHASVEDSILALQIGAYDFVVKPFDPEQLIVSVSRAARQVRSAREAAQLDDALSNSEASLRALVDAVQAMLLELDATGRIIRSNRAVSLALGLDLDQVLGLNFFDDLVAPEDRDRIRGYLQCMLRGDCEVDGPHIEGRLVLPGQEQVRWVHWNFSLFELDRSESRIYASGIDLTHVRALERQQRVQEKLAAVGSLSAGLAHEIRNPLNAMSLQMQLLQRRIARQSKDPSVEAPLKVMYSEIERLSNLVDDFLRFARPSGLRPGPVELVSLVNQVVGLQQLVAKERGVLLRCESGPELLHLMADGQKLRQILVNLIANAVDASSEGSEVLLTVAREGERAVIEVRDRGKGIPESELSRIFEPFFSTKDHGTGLGMAICHRLISLHEGKISIDSKPGVGTCVRIELGIQACTSA